MADKMRYYFYVPTVRPLSLNNVPLKNDPKILKTNLWSKIIIVLCQIKINSQN